MRLFDSNNLTGSQSVELDVVQAVRRRVRSSIKHISSEQAVIVGELVIHASSEEILVHDLLAGEGKYSDVAVATSQRLLGQVVEREIGLGGRIHRNGIRSTSTGVGCGTQISASCRGGRHRGNRSYSLRLPDSLVIREEERVVFHDRAAKSSAELVPLERRDCPSIEEVPGVEPAVTKKLISTAMERVRAGACNCVDHSAGCFAVFR